MVLWTSLGIDGCFSAYTLKVSTWHWLFILLKFSHVWACLVSWRWCLREFNSNEVFGFEWLKIKEAVVGVNARGREWGQEGTLRVMMAKWTCCHFSGLLSTTKHATLGEFSTFLAAMTLGYNIGPSKHIYQKGIESLQRNKCHLGSTLERQTAGQFQLPEGGVAKVTHKPRLNTSSESVASRGEWAVSSRPIPQCNSGHPSWRGSLPVWLLASWDILYSLKNSFSAHTIFQLAATENSDRVDGLAMYFQSNPGTMPNTSEERSWKPKWQKLF